MAEATVVFPAPGDPHTATTTDRSLPNIRRSLRIMPMLSASRRSAGQARSGRATNPLIIGWV